MIADLLVIAAESLPTCCWGSHCLPPAQPAALKPADPVLLQMQIGLKNRLRLQQPRSPASNVPLSTHRGSFNRLHELLLCLGADRIVGVLERPAGHHRVNPPRWGPHWVPTQETNWHTPTSSTRKYRLAECHLPCFTLQGHSPTSALW